MIISKRQYYCNYLLMIAIMGVLIPIGAPIANHYYLHIDLIDVICKYTLIGEVSLIAFILLIAVIINRGLKNYISKMLLLSSLESNLISIGAYTKLDNLPYAILPKIKIKNGKVRIKLSNLKIRTVIEKYLDSFSTALPERYIVEDYFITQNNSEVIIVYEDIRNYKPEQYFISEYKNMIQSLKPLELYFDKKHIVNVNDYPHFLISGASGSGKSYFANELVIQAILKGWEVVICDLKRSYGLYKAYTDYVYEVEDILEKLISVESEMSERMERLQPELDRNPRVLAVDIGYKPKLVVIEEYISLQSSLDKKKKEELERVVKNLSVLARQANIHLMIVMQSAGTENINSTTRSNLTKVLLGNAQSNILTATFGNGVDIPNAHTKMNKGEGLIQLDRITMLRVPKIDDIEDFKNQSSEVPQADLR